MYTVYVIENMLDHRKYVGFTKYTAEERFQQHQKRGFYLTSAITKHGAHNFTVNVLDTCSSRAAAAQLEIKYIAELHTNDSEYGYNLTRGGDGTVEYVKTAEDREVLRQIALENHRCRRIGMYGKKHSEETKQKMREANPKKPRTPRTLKVRLNRGEHNSMFGHKHSAETINKLREKALLRPKRVWSWNPETNQQRLVAVGSILQAGFVFGRPKAGAV